MENKQNIISITSFAYWNIIFKKLVETFISVKLWIIAIATYFSFKMTNIYVEIKDVVLSIALNPEEKIDGVNLVSTLAHWSDSLLDVTLAMFTGVIVVITLSREVFKHARISNDYYFPEDNTPEDNTPEDNRFCKRKDNRFCKISDRAIIEKQIKDRII